jgi:chromosome segregation ATPase
MKHSLARAAVALASATLALGLSATSANATGTSAHEVGHEVGSGSGGHFSGPVQTGKERDIARLQKALRAAKHERAEARAEVSDRRVADSDADLAANAAKVEVIAATEKMHAAKADLAVALTNLHEIRNLIANGSLLIEENRAAHDAATAAVTKAQEALTAAETKVADLKNTLDIKTAERDVADRDAKAAAAEVDRINSDLAAAQSALADANVLFQTEEAEFSQASQTFSDRLQAYRVCYLMPNDEITCEDFTGVNAVRGEVTEAYRLYIAAQTEWAAAREARDQADMAYAAAGVDLSYWQDEHASLAAVRDAAQDAVDAAQSALDAAQPAVTQAAAALDEERDALAAIVAEGKDLADRIATAQSDEKAAVKVEAAKSAALADAETVLSQGKDIAERATGTAARTERDVQAAQGSLDDARKQVAKVKDRLKKIRQSR